MSQPDSPRGVLNSPRGSISEHDKTLSRDISLAVAAIIEESKTYKDVDYLESSRNKYPDSLMGYNELLQNSSLDSAGNTSSKTGLDSRKLKKLKNKKIFKKVKISTPKATKSITSTDKPPNLSLRPPVGPLRSAPSPLQTTQTTKKLTGSLPKKFPSSPEIKPRLPRPPTRYVDANYTRMRAKTSVNDTRKKNKKKSPHLALRKATASEAVNTLGLDDDEIPSFPEVPQANEVQEQEQEPEELRPESTSHHKRRALPSPPNYKDYGQMEIVQYIASVQKFIDQLGYERDGEPTIRVNTKLSMKHLMGTAKQLIKAGDHIKCLHALVLGIHFTNNCNIVERFPLHFRSLVNGKTYKHVTLGIYLLGNYGALGISRDAGLQDKPPIYPRLSDMINDYFRHYTDAGHELKEVQIGSIINHNALSLEPITWKLAKIDMQALKLAYETEIEKVSRKLRSQMGTACLKCTHMDPYEYIEKTATTKVLKSQAGGPPPQSAVQKSKSLSIAAMKSRSYIAPNPKSSATSQGKRTLPATAASQKPKTKPKSPLKPSTPST